MYLCNKIVVYDWNLYLLWIRDWGDPVTQFLHSLNHLLVPLTHTLDLVTHSATVVSYRSLFVWKIFWWDGSSAERRSHRCYTKFDVLRPTVCIPPRCSMQFLRPPNGHTSPQISFPSAWLHVFEEPRSSPWDENLTPEGDFVNRQSGECHSACLAFACHEVDLGWSIFR